MTTDGNAASNETDFYEGAGAIEHLDWRILRTRDCYSADYERRKCAEVLVPDRVPQELVVAIHTIDDAVASDLREQMSALSARRQTLRPMIERVTANRGLFY